MYIVSCYCIACWLLCTLSEMTNKRCTINLFHTRCLLWNKEICGLFILEFFLKCKILIQASSNCDTMLSKWQQLVFEWYTSHQSRLSIKVVQPFLRDVHKSHSVWLQTAQRLRWHSIYIPKVLHKSHCWHIISDPKNRNGCLIFHLQYTGLAKISFQTVQTSHWGPIC